MSHTVCFGHIFYFCFSVLWFLRDRNWQNCRQTFFKISHSSSCLSSSFLWRSVCFTFGYNNPASAYLLRGCAIFSSASWPRCELKETEIEHNGIQRQIIGNTALSWQQFVYPQYWVFQFPFCEWWMLPTVGGMECWVSSSQAGGEHTSKLAIGWLCSSAALWQLWGNPSALMLSQLSDVCSFTFTVHVHMTSSHIAD